MKRRAQRRENKIKSVWVWTVLICCLMFSGCVKSKGSKDTAWENLEKKVEDVAEADSRENEEKKEQKKEDSEPEEEMILSTVSLQTEVESASDKDIFYLSGLKITLPKGWEVEERKNEEENTVCVLVDKHTEYAKENEEIKAHKDGYEHEIIITGYKIENMPENPVKLAGKIREQFDAPELWSQGAATGTDELDGVCWMYGEDSKDYEYEYFIFLKETDRQWEMFHVTESMASGYENDAEMFGEFLACRRIKSVDSGVTINEELGEKRSYYYQFRTGEEEYVMSVMEMQAERLQITNYVWGEYDSILSQNDYKKIHPSFIGIQDMDGDGDEDFIYRYYELDSYSEDGDYEGCLWEKEKQEFVYVTSEEMVASSSLIREKEKETEAKIAEQEEDKKRMAILIPEGLIAYISENLLGTREEIRDMMLPMVSDRELTMEEVKALAAENKEIWLELQRIVSCYDGTGVWLLVDADNDGTEDVMLCRYLGGSCGPVDYILFRGLEDGTYEKTDMQPRIKEEFAFIRYEGRNYLARTTYHFGKKIYDGIELDYYKEGKYQGSVWIRIAAVEGDEARTLTTPYLKEEKYRILEQNLYEFSYTYEAYMESPKGTAEVIIEGGKRYDRSSDFNNDGVTEYYHADMWLTTNYYTADCMEFYTNEEQEEADDLLSDVIYEQEEGTPMYLWVDETEFGNVTYVLFEKGLYDFSICGYLVTTQNVEKLIQTDCVIEQQVVAEYGKS